VTVFHVNVDFIRRKFARKVFGAKAVSWLYGMHWPIKLHEWLVEDFPFYLKFFGQIDPPPLKTPTSSQYLLVASYLYQLAKKNQLSLMGMR